jgi:hypothetical protein
MRLLRCCLVGLATTLVAATAVRLLMPSVLAGGEGFEAALVRGCAAVGCGCAVWGWLGALTVVVDVLRGPDPAGARAVPGVPPALRRLVLVACGVALTATVTPALATPASDTTAGLPAVVADLPFPARALDQPAEREVVVRPGDSLWAITARRLDADPGDADIASGWRELYRHNRDVVGDDPSLIHPGQRLELPDRLEEPS